MEADWFEMNIESFVKRELQNNKYNLIDILDNVMWIIIYKEVEEIFYHVSDPDLVRDIKRAIAPAGIPELERQLYVSAINPVINRVLNTRLDLGKPLVLYLGDNKQRCEYTDQMTAFEVLGAIRTYYLGTVNDNEDQFIIKYNNDVFTGMSEYKNGYELLLYEAE